jgi:hypothetical protein
MKRSLWTPGSAGTSTVGGWLRSVLSCPLLILSRAFHTHCAASTIHLLFLSSLLCSEFSVLGNGRGSNKAPLVKTLSYKILFLSSLGQNSVTTEELN